MDSLPPELHLMIFSLLPVSDAIRLRLVSKQWNRLLNSMKRRSLAVFDQDPDGHCEIVCDEHRVDEWNLDPADSIECRDENLLLTAELPPMFRSVRKLTTHFYSETILSMSRFYNRFEELEELTCFHNGFHNGYNQEMKIILNLPRLNKLIVREEDLSCFDLRTPRLVHLKVPGLSACDLYYPDRLRSVEAYLFDHRRVDFTKFTNLELLIVNGRDWTFITDQFLSNLKSLKELHFCAHNLPSRETMNLRYRRRDLKLYLYGFDLERPLEIIDEKFPHGSRVDETRVIVRNYEKTAETVYWEVIVEYNELTRTGLNPNFFTKFPRLEGVVVGGQVADEDALLEFLLKARPKVFTMENHLLSANFRDRLALQCDSIQMMQMVNLKNIDSSQFEHLEFLVKMRSLTKIEILHPETWTPGLDFLVRLFENCERLTEIYFSIEYYDRSSFSPYWLISGNDSLYASLKLEGRTDLLHVLRALQRETNFKQRTSIEELVFLIEKYNYQQFLMRDHAKKLIRGELYYIYASPYA